MSQESFVFRRCRFCHSLIDSRDWDYHVEWHDLNNEFLSEMQEKIDGIVDTIIKHAPDWIIKGENK